ncbi:AAA family ATPase [Nocardia sp. NBC_00416]|uniref:AAA family ATPase n=1 Tax=Nocardia sp. NBC_00416 TaxID=2975991 RepID=UPI002E1C1B78
MGKLLVLVNGLPGSGKSTLGRALARTLAAEFLSKDTVKEALAGCVTDIDAVPEIGGIAMDAVWALARAAPRDVVVIDSWWFRPRDLRFAEAGIETVAPERIVEVWCEVPVGVARSRYAGRRRAALHRDELRLAADWDSWAEQATPLGIGPVVVVDTTRPVDCAELAIRIGRVAARPAFGSGAAGHRPAPGGAEARNTIA